MPRPTQDTSRRLQYFAHRAFTFFGVYFHILKLYCNFVTPIKRSYNPSLKLVWALSVSLATTREIDFSFFSSGYLDVSVPQVTLKM